MRSGIHSVPAVLAVTCFSVDTLSALSAPPTEAYGARPLIQAEPPSPSGEPNQPPSSAQIKQLEATPALHIEYTWGDSIPAERKAEYLDILNGALLVVKSFPPAEDNLFYWKGDRKILENKHFQFYFAESNDPTVKSIIDRAPGGTSITSDAMSVMVTGEDNQAFMMTIAFVDKLFYDKQRKERPDATVRTIVALAHEIYGSVQQQLHLDPQKAPPFTFEDRKQAEIKSFRAGIAFLERLMESEQYGKFSEKLKHDFKEILEREKEKLEFWKQIQSFPEEP